MSSHDPMNGGAGENGDPAAGAILERFGATLRRAAVWEDPPDDLDDRIIAQVAALRTASAGHAEDITSTDTPPLVAINDGRRRGRAWVWPALAAAAAVVAFAAGALLVGGDDDNRSVEPVAEVQLAPTDLAVGARADGTVIDAGAGYSISIQVAGLPPAPEGEYYEGWLHDTETGDWVSVGTFHMREGDSRVVLWSGVPISRYRELVVTAEFEGSSGGHGDILLSGQLQPT